MIMKIVYSDKRTATLITRAALSLIIVIVLAAVLLGHALSSSLEKSAYTIQMADGVDGDVQSSIDEFRKRNPKLKMAPSDESPDMIVGIRERPGYSSSVVEGTPPLVVKAGDKEVRFREKRDYLLLYKSRDRFVSRLQDYLEKKGPKISFTACGDIIPGRHVAERMAQHGPYYPFEKVAPYLIGSDIVYANLESPLSDKAEPPFTGTSFIAPSTTIEGLRICGFNLLSVANNHSTDFGRDAFADTLELLKANNVLYVGGGANSSEAFSPVFMDVKGIKFAFLSYNSVEGAISATSNQPGVANIQMAPYYKDDPSDIETVSDSVSEAGNKADVVIVFFHWGNEEVYYPNDSVVKMAHAACDAGADMVIGTHPHYVQPIEYYNGSLIAYSLGNFIFDQMFSEQVREGIIMNSMFEGDTLCEVELLPYKIFDYCQPIVLTGDSGQHVLDHVLKISKLSGRPVPGKKG